MAAEALLAPTRSQNSARMVGMTDAGATGESNRRTHRRRNRGGRSAAASGAKGAVAPAKTTPPPPSTEPAPAAKKRPVRRDEARATGSPRSPRAPRADQGDRGLRDLVGAGPSQLGPIRAMRARDVNRPHDEDEAAAERELVIVRRHWQPKDEPGRN
jgi:hypothetical protein